jgi:ubiquitin carboxyl-terminal hydrolase L3
MAPQSAIKRFVPLENNPEVMTSLLHNLGLSHKVAFQDVFSIDEPELLAFVPRPAYALLLVFPVSDTYEKFRSEEDSAKEEYSGKGEGEEVVWFKQTIGNACGMIGVLHAVSNGPARSYIGKWALFQIPLMPRTTISTGGMLTSNSLLRARHRFVEIAIPGY